VLLAVAGCGGGGGELTTRLLDGSVPPAVAAAVAEVRGAVMTIARDVPAGADRATACARRLSERRAPSPIVERIGVDGRSLTFADGSRVYACDAAAQAREGAAASCGGATGIRKNGALTDPRLDLANCTDADGAAVAFVWIEPSRNAAFVAVERDGWVEVYPVRAGLPVRVATTEGIDGSSVGLTVKQYADDGSEVLRNDIQAHVAG
jgi:hypothetical protein